MEFEVLDDGRQSIFNDIEVVVKDYLNGSLFFYNRLKSPLIPLLFFLMIGFEISIAYGIVSKPDNWIVFLKQSFVILALLLLWVNLFYIISKQIIVRCELTTLFQSGVGDFFLGLIPFFLLLPVTLLGWGKGNQGISFWGGLFVLSWATASNWKKILKRVYNLKPLYVAVAYYGTMFWMSIITSVVLYIGAIRSIVTMTK